VKNTAVICDACGWDLRLMVKYPKPSEGEDDDSGTDPGSQGIA
jgi:hypothetical protein